MAGIAAKLGLYMADNTILRDIFQSLETPQDEYGCGAACVEIDRPILLKAMKMYLGEVALIQGKYPPYNTMKEILNRHMDLFHRARIIIAQCRKPTVGGVNLENIQPFVSKMGGIRSVMAIQGTILNYKDLYPFATNDAEAILKYIEEENIFFLKKIQGSVNLIFSNIHRTRDLSLIVYSTNIEPLYHVYYNNVHFITSNKNSLYLFKILENDIKISEVPQDKLLKYTMRYPTPTIIQWWINHILMPDPLMGLRQD